MVGIDFGTVENQDYLMYRVNEMRAYYGYPPFEPHAPYTCAAKSWSKRMWRLKFCGHRDPKTGEEFWDRIVLCDGKIYRAAEIVACAPPSIEQALANWLNEPTHRNILFSQGAKAGIGVAGDDEENPKWYTLIVDY